jgi:hypothetical protein
LKQRDVSAAFRKKLDALSLYVVRAFMSEPPEINALQKAITRARDGLALASASGAPPGDAAAMPMLAAMLGALDVFAGVPAITSVGAPAPPQPAEAPPRAREPVWQPRVLDRATAETPAFAPAPVAFAPALQRAAPVADPDSARKNLASIVAKLTALYERRANLLDDLLATWGALKALDTQALHAIQSLRWLGGAGLAGAEAALANAEDEASRFAAVTALLQIGAREHVFAWLGQTPETACPGALFAFRMGADRADLERLLELGVRTNGAWRVRVLADLAEHGRCAPQELLALLDDPDDTVAVGAAEILAWVGRDADLDEAVRGRARDASPARRPALLFAGLALGSRESLLELRRVVDAGAPVTARDIDALAVAGEMEDARRLIHLAARQPELAPLAVLAAGHLGDLASVAAIAAVDVAAPVRARALRTVQGPTPPVSPETVGVRVLYGQPWTVSRALGRLAAPDELLRARGWYALEVAIRSGAHPLIVFDPRASADVQEAAADALRAAIGRQRGHRSLLR